MSEPICNCGNEGNVFHEIDCPVNIMFGAEPVNPKPSMKDPAATAFPAPTRSLGQVTPGVDLLGDLRVIAANSFFPPEGGELAVQKKKNGDVSFIFVERESAGTVREHRATLAPGLQMKLMNLLHAEAEATPSKGATKNPAEYSAFFGDYDFSIHSNPQAMVWAKFFVETIRQVAARNCLPARGGTQEDEEIARIVCDESYMLGWFANAMMAMHDHMESKRRRAETDKLNRDVAEHGRKVLTELRRRDPQIPGWMWAIFISGVFIACTMIFVAISKGAL